MLGTTTHCLLATAARQVLRRPPFSAHLRTVVLAKQEARSCWFQTAMLGPAPADPAAASHSSSTQKSCCIGAAAGEHVTSMSGPLRTMLPVLRGKESHIALLGQSA